MQVLKKRKDIIFALLMGFILILTIFPTVVSAYYTTYNADDFSYAISIGLNNTGILQRFIASYKFVKHVYFNWQGTYSSEFLHAIMTPLIGNQGWKRLHIIMTLNVLLSVLAIAFFIYSVCRCIKIEIKGALIVVIICIVGLFGFYSWPEIFTWYCGATIYSFPLFFSMLGCGLMTRDNKTVVQTIIASIFMIIASGGSLEVAGFGCFLILIFGIIKKLQGKLDKKDCFIFAFAVIGALINTLAPGNYVRHEGTGDSELHILVAVIRSVREIITWIENIIIDTPFVFLMLVVLLIGFKNRKYVIKNTKIIYIYILLNIMLPFVTIFPVCLGYGYFKGDMPNRCQFVLAVSIIIALLQISLSVGRLLSERTDRLFTKEIYIALIMFYMAMTCVNTNWKISETTLYDMYKQVESSEFKNYYNDSKEIYKSIASDTNSDVFFHYKPIYIYNYQCLVLSEDSETWENKATANYYGKNSIQYVAESVYYRDDGSKVFRLWPNLINCDLSYVTISKVNGNTNERQYIQVLESFDKNIIVETDETENATVVIEVFDSANGENKIDELVIE